MTHKFNEDRRKISQMKNLGPACQKELNAVGIFTASQLKAIGAEVACLCILEARKNGLYQLLLYCGIPLRPLSSHSRSRLASHTKEEKVRV